MPTDACSPPSAHRGCRRRRCRVGSPARGSAPAFQPPARRADRRASRCSTPPTPPCADGSRCSASTASRSPRTSRCRRSTRWTFASTNSSTPRTPRRSSRSTAAEGSSSSAPSTRRASPSPACANASAAEWYLAAGDTLDGSVEELVLSNPHDYPAVVDITLATERGVRVPEAYQGFAVPARSVRVIDVGTRSSATRRGSGSASSPRAGGSSSAGRSCSTRPSGPAT